MGRSQRPGEVSQKGCPADADPNNKLLPARSAPLGSGWAHNISLQLYVPTFRMTSRVSDN